MKTLFPIFMFAVMNCNYFNVTSKDLGHIGIFEGDYLRDETISLEGDDMLTIKGIVQQTYFPSTGGEAQTTLEYVADKLGYRAKFKLRTSAGASIAVLPPLSASSIKVASFY
ncbi:uncharacterized protein LOC131803111 [Musca domestica]|uniref:Uncharacterized protein LOC131803111 n=1 Tax=Musca domestica TaxID=7370 RepID=A0ABM3V325_MUSDO|nr:uncharacterized protein LOC131803111 [Musca domestica]